MEQQANLIRARRRELQEDTERHRMAISANTAEMAELDIAEKVILRLSGASSAYFDEPPLPSYFPAFDGEPRKKRARGVNPLTDVILQIVQEKHDAGIVGMEPRDALSRARELWKPDVEGTLVSTTFWRLMKLGKLEKVEGTSIYRLPQMKEPTDFAPEEASMGSHSETRAEGREAAPGGGT